MDNDHIKSSKINLNFNMKSSSPCISSDYDMNQSLPSSSSSSTSVFTPPSILLHHSPLKSPVQYYRYNTRSECSDRFIPIREPNNWNLRYNMIKETTLTPMKCYRYKDYHYSSLQAAAGTVNATVAGPTATLSSFSTTSSPTATTLPTMINGQTITNQIQGNIGSTNGGGTGGVNNLIGSSSSSGASNANNNTNQSEMFRNGLAYQCLLKNELLGAEIEDINEYKQIEDRKVLTPLMNRNVFRFRTREIRSEPTSPYSLSPISSKSQKMLRSPRKTARKISKMPFKILDAPELQDDFYLNLVDWSSTNILSVGLGFSVYLWSACTSQVTRLCDFTSDGHSITSVSWSERGNLVAVGTQNGFVQIWDVATLKCLKQFDGHTSRVGCLAWNCDTLSSGSRDRYIFQRDIRSPSTIPERKLLSHRQEVCGLKWSPDNQLLASGGNDNRIHIWNQASNQPVQTYTDHLAAVKAIAWSPHHHGLLASGGGTSDRSIRFWNTVTSQPIQCVDTGSQVCNLAWSKHASELVSTHGYSQNQILVWKYPSLVQVAKLTGHTCRVLYLAMSPDGESIVTGAGDETLRFWNVFSKARSQKEIKSALDLFSTIR